MKKLVYMILMLAISSSGIAMEAPPSPMSERQVEAQKRLDANLIRAIRAQNATQVRQLLENGANIYAIDESGKTALEIAGDTANAEIVGLVYAKVQKKKPETLLETLPVELRGEINKMVADDVNRAKTIDEAIENTKGYVSKNTELVSRLIKVKFGQSALDDALISASYYKPDFAKILITLGANVEAVREPFKESPLFIAASQNLIDLVKELLNKGANVNVQNVKGFTPLMVATNINSNNPTQSLELVRILLNAAANPLIRNNIHKATARDYLEQNLKPIKAGLISRPADVLTVMNQEIELLKEAEKAYQTNL